MVVGARGKSSAVVEEAPGGGRGALLEPGLVVEALELVDALHHERGDEAAAAASRSTRPRAARRARGRARGVARVGES